MSFEVQLETSEIARALYWKEPIFESQNHLREIYKSKIPGNKFTVGLHEIQYIATDMDGLNAKCSFNISVKG